MISLTIVSIHKFSNSITFFIVQFSSFYIIYTCLNLSSKFKQNYLVQWCAINKKFSKKSVDYLDRLSRKVQKQMIPLGFSVLHFWYQVILRIKINCNVSYLCQVLPKTIVFIWGCMFSWFKIPPINSGIIWWS